MLNCIYEDSSIWIVEKPAGVDAQEGRTLSDDMPSRIRNYMSHRESTSCGRVLPVYVGVVHRLDKPVRGLMVYAKTKAPLRRFRSSSRRVTSCIKNTGHWS